MQNTPGTSNRNIWCFLFCRRRNVIYYDEVEVSSVVAQKHFKAAIQARNREMVDRSDLVICYIQRRSGGAYQSVKYAIKRGMVPL